MKLYTKPSAMFLSATGTAGAGGCTTSKEDLTLLGEIFGITDWSTAFATGEGCTVEYPIEDYCKFASVNNGSAVAVLSS